MNNDSNDIVMNHCPFCDIVCLVSKTDTDAAEAANKLVCISCHQCQKEFAIDGDQTKDIKTARKANLKIVTCPHCKKPVTIPHPAPDPLKMDLFCPLCNCNLDDDSQKTEDALSQSESAKPNPVSAEIKATRQPFTRSKSATSYMPLYVLIIFCMGAYLFWAYETGLLPVDTLPFDQWLKVLE
jgi:uncharacterized protein YbaR (Trm112 family)